MVSIRLQSLVDVIKQTKSYSCKGTVMNRELFNRNFFVPIPDVDSNEFENLIDSWAIEYAEIYASKT